MAVYRYEVALTDGTVGRIVDVDGDGIRLGQWVTVSLWDENGNPAQKRGKVKEILTEDWIA